MTNVISFGGLAINDGLYVTHIVAPYSQPSKKITMVERHGGDPVATAVGQNVRNLVLDVTLYHGAAIDDARRAMYQAFDTSAASRALVVSDDDGANERYLMCLVSDVLEIENEEGTGTHFAVPVIVARDGVMWRSVDEVSEGWNVAASGDTTVIAVDGDLDVYPVYTVTPRAAKATGNVYKRAWVYSWFESAAYEQCPVRLHLNTKDLIDNSKIADETNVAVYIDGKETRRWIVDFNTTASGVWINLDLAAGLKGILSGYNTAANTGIEIASDVTTLILSSDISVWPTSGMVRIGNEIFTYEAVDRANKRLLGVQRAAFGTSAGAQAVGTGVYWMQHLVEYVYGDGITAATAFPNDTYTNGEVIPYDDRKPMIDLSLSDNETWYWDETSGFGEDRPLHATQKPRSARWTGRIIGDSHVLVTGSYPPPSVYDYIGVVVDSDRRVPPRGWSVPLPHASTLISYDAYGTIPWEESGETGHGQRWRSFIGSVSGDWLWVHTEFPEPDIQTTPWEDFINGKAYTDTGVAAVAPAGASLALRLGGYSRPTIELYSISVTFAYTFSAAKGAEVAAYQLAAKLDNLTTGEGVTIQLPMELDETLTIDTGAHTVIYSKGRPNQYQAVRRDGVRLPVLRLQPGSNTLQFTDAGTTDVDVAVSYRPRWYS